MVLSCIDQMSWTISTYQRRRSLLLLPVEGPSNSPCTFHRVQCFPIPTVLSPSLYGSGELSLHAGSSGFEESPAARVPIESCFLSLVDGLDISLVTTRPKWVCWYSYSCLTRRRHLILIGEGATPSLFSYRPNQFEAPAVSSGSSRRCHMANVCMKSTLVHPRISTFVMCPTKNHEVPECSPKDTVRYSVTNFLVQTCHLM